MNNKYKLTYPSADDYYDINVFNNNFSKLCDGIDEAKAGGFKSEVIIAAHNSKSGMKGCADFVCTTADCTNIIKSAIDKVFEGGTLRFLDGDYYFKNELIVNKSLHFKGENKFATTFHKTGINFYLLIIKSIMTSISNIGFMADVEGYNLSFLSLDNDKTEVDSCYFVTPKRDDNNGASPIKLNYNYGYTAIRNCLFEKDSSLNYVVDAEKCDWMGIMSGNYVINSENYSRMPVGVNFKNAASHELIDFGSQKTVMYVHSVLLK